MIVSILGAITLVCIIIFILGIVVGRNTINPDKMDKTVANVTEEDKKPVVPNVETRITEEIKPSEIPPLKTEIPTARAEILNTPTPVPPPPTPAVKPVSGKSSFSVQVSFVSSKDEAEKIRAKLKQQGFKAYVETLEGKTRGYRVRVGSFKTRSEATDALRKLKKQGYPKAWIDEK
jgi:cell division protein FtsN